MKKYGPVLSVVILHYNRPSELSYCLKKTMQYLKDNFEAGSYEVIVVDNASTEKLPHLPESVHLIRSDKNRGVSSLNLGFEKAKGTYVLELDDDSYIESGITSAIDYLAKNPQVGILALTINGENNPINATHNLSRITSFIGCGVLIKKEVLNLTGGYSPWIFIYANEYDLTMHALYFNFETRFFAKASVFHRVAQTHRTTYRLTYHSSKNYVISHIVYWSGLYRIARITILVLMLILKIPKDSQFISNLYHTIRGIADGVIAAQTLPKKALPKKRQRDIMFHAYR